MEESAPLKSGETPVLFTDVRWAPCSLGRACSLLMMPFVLGIVALTYVPYTRHFGDRSLSGTICLTVFHLLLGLLLASYFQVMVSAAQPMLR